MSPDDFGMSPLATLAHTGDPTPPPGFNQFWSTWVRRVGSVEARFVEPSEDERAGCAGPGVTHLIPSLDDVRVGVRLTEPEGAVQGAVVTLHGYAVDPDDDLRIGRAWARRGLAVVDLRVRGYPGSQLDTGDLTSTPRGYITNGLGDPAAWSIAGATADVVCAVRALRATYGAHLHVGLHGESFGGGLAILAASAARDLAPVHRLAIGLPTFGDWLWRARRRAMGGSGGEAIRLMLADPEREETIRTCLGLFDAVIHARRVEAPVVCKLATLDEVVPAPTAAAIYNALGTAPGLKWRYVVKHGHADPGLLDMAELRRLAMFEKIADAFLDPSVKPDDLMLRLSRSVREGAGR